MHYCQDLFSDLAKKPNYKRISFLLFGVAEHLLAALCPLIFLFLVQNRTFRAFISLRHLEILVTFLYLSSVLYFLDLSFFVKVDFLLGDIAFQ